jgi:DNA-damage-inducible protein D
MEQQLIAKLHRNFEDYAHEKDGVIFWYARELQGLLGYGRWENFENVLSKAKIACENAKNLINDHFRDVTKMIPMPKGAEKEILDIMLTRYACYLIAQNGDPRKDEIAFAMTYFAVQTRKQEVVEQRLAEWERLHAREKLSVTEKELSGIIFERGVDNKGFARIRSKGDKALFGGYSTGDMKVRLGIPDSRPLADFLPAVTIKAKDLASEITNHNLKKDRSLRGEVRITDEHVKNNENVRDTLTRSGIRPEFLSAEEDVKKVERKLKSEDKKLPKVTRKLSS